MAVFTTGTLENRGRDIRSLAVRAVNAGVEAANVLLEVFHAPNAADGPSVQQMYVQRLVSVAPNQLQTFDDVFADLDAVTVRVTTSGLGQDEIVVSVAARDAQRRPIAGLQSSQPARIGPPPNQSEFGSN